MCGVSVGGVLPHLNPLKVDQLHLVKDDDERRLLCQVHQTVGGWLQEHCAAVRDAVEPGTPHRSVVTLTLSRSLSHSPQFSERLLKGDPALRESLDLLAEVVEGVVQLCAELSLSMLSHEVVSVMHVLRATQSGHNLSHLRVELYVPVLLLADDDRTLPWEREITGGLQEITGNYRGGYKRLQGITSNYREFRGIPRDTFMWK